MGRMFHRIFRSSGRRAMVRFEDQVKDIDVSVKASAVPYAEEKAVHVQPVDPEKPKDSVRVYREGSEKSA